MLIKYKGCKYIFSFLDFSSTTYKVYPSLKQIQYDSKIQLMEKYPKKRNTVAKRITSLSQEPSGS